MLVARSTTYQAQGNLLERVLHALGRLRLRGLVTLGPALDASAFRAPPNVVLVASAPHSAVLREASAVVTHGGHGTVVRALAQGVPLLVLPMGRQNDNGARVAARSAGIVLSADAPSSQIREELRRLLHEPTFVHGADALERIAESRAGVAPTLAAETP